MIVPQNFIVLSVLVAAYCENRSFTLMGFALQSLYDDYISSSRLATVKTVSGLKELLLGLQSDALMHLRIY